MILDKTHNKLIDDPQALEPEEVFEVVEAPATRAKLLAGDEVDTAIWSTLTGLAEVADGGWNRADGPSVEEIFARFDRLRAGMRAELGVQRPVSKNHPCCPEH